MKIKQACVQGERLFAEEDAALHLKNRLLIPESGCHRTEERVITKSPSVKKIGTALSGLIQLWFREKHSRTAARKLRQGRNIPGHKSKPYVTGRKGPGKGNKPPGKVCKGLGKQNEAPGKSYKGLGKENNAPVTAAMSAGTGAMPHD